MNFVHHYKDVHIKATMVKPVGEDKFEVKLAQDGNNVITSNPLIDALNIEEEHGNQFWTCQKLSGHRKDLTNLGSWKIKALSEIGDETWKPVPAISKDDPIQMAKYGWK